MDPKIIGGGVVLLLLIGGIIWWAKSGSSTPAYTPLTPMPLPGQMPQTGAPNLQQGIAMGAGLLQTAQALTR